MTLVDWQNKNKLEYLLGLLIFCILKNVDKGVLAKCLKGGWMYILKKIGIWARRGHWSIINFAKVDEGAGAINFAKVDGVWGGE